MTEPYNSRLKICKNIFAGCTRNQLVNEFQYTFKSQLIISGYLEQCVEKVHETTSVIRDMYQEGI